MRRVRSRAVLETLAAWVADGTLHPQVTEIFAFAQASDALKLVERGHARGKVVVSISE